ncbi:hypothetical protein [Paenibacillus sp. MMO-177]
MRRIVKDIQKQGARALNDAAHRKGSRIGRISGPKGTIERA